MKNVLLINPSNELHQYGTKKEMAPLGLVSIAATLKNAGYEVMMVDLEFGAYDIEKILLEFKPIMVGIAGTSTARFTAFEIARLVKEIHPPAVVVYGGVHATFTAHDTLSHVPAMDIIARGEGEFILLDILQGLTAGDCDYARISGISYRDNGEIVHNPARPRIENLDQLPFPTKDIVDLTLYDLKLDLLGDPAASIVTSRGCPINCSFCSASAMFGRTLTRRSAGHVVDEMQYVVDTYGFSGFKVFDSTFTLNRHHAESICDEIIRRGLDIKWECEIRVNTVDYALLQKMKKAGCYLVDFGIESASERVLKRMHKGINLQQVEEVLKWTHDLGISQRAFFTFGHIEETVQDAELTLEYIHKHLNKISLLGIGVGLRLYPGTEVESYARAQGWLDGFSWSEPYQAPQNKILNLPGNIPTFIQPQMGYEELYRINKRVLALQARNPRYILRRLKKSHSTGDIKRFAGMFKRLVISKLGLSYQ